jgi:hypothetical protein
VSCTTAVGLAFGAAFLLEGALGVVADFFRGVGTSGHSKQCRGVE